jgi:hypothetical protein
MRLVNLTNVNLVFVASGESYTVAKCGLVARVIDRRSLQESIAVDGRVSEEADVAQFHVDIDRVIPGETANLPEPVEGTLYIVNRIVCERAQRPDVVFPIGLSRFPDDPHSARCRALGAFV